MGRLPYNMLALCLSLTGLTPAFAQSVPLSSHRQAAQNDKDRQSGELFLRAYQLAKKAETDGLAQKWQSAIKQSQQAERILATIVRDNPDWNVSLVTYRRKIVADNLSRFNAELKKQGRVPQRDPSSHLPEYSRESLAGVGTGATGTGREAIIPLDSTPDVTPGTIDDNRQLYSELMRTREELRRMVQAYKQLRTQFTEAKKQLVISERYKEDYEQQLAKAKESLKEERVASNDVIDTLSKQVRELEEKLRVESMTRQDAEQRVAQLDAELRSLEQLHQQVVAQRDSLLAENAQLKEIAELNNPDKVKALLDQNLTVTARLEEAEKRIENLEAELAAQHEEKDIILGQLEEARSEARELREEMARLYDENLGYRRRISELTNQYQEIESNLNNFSGQTKIDPAMVEENKLLRSIVEKQKRSIAVQQNARKILIETYKQIKGHNAATLESLERLDEQSSLDLTHMEDLLLEAVQGTGEGEVEGAAAIRVGLQLEALATGAAKAFDAKRYTAAEQLYRTLVDEKPDHLIGLINLGSILLYRNKHQEAIAYLNRASHLSPEQATSYYMCGIANYLLNNNGEAAEQFRKCLERDPANANAFFYLANIESLQQQPDKALKYLAAAVKLNPALGDAHYNMSRIYIEQNKLADAARAYNRAVESGALPDSDLETLLAQNEGNLGELGEDLIAIVIPEQEADHLREARQAAIVTAGAGDGEEQSEEMELTVAEIRARMMKDIPAAPTPSPAGQGHELDESYFRSASIVRGEEEKELRVKLAFEEQRLRQRGGPLPELAGEPAEEKPAEQ